MTSLNAVASGFGFCFFSVYVDEIVPKGVVTRPLEMDPPPLLDLLFAYRTDDTMPALMRVVSLVRDNSPFHLEGTTLSRPRVRPHIISL